MNTDKSYKYLFRISLISIFMLGLFFSCNSHIDIDFKKQSFLGSLFLSRNSSVNVNVVESINLNPGEMVTLYSMVPEEEGGYSNIPVKWSLINDIGDLTVTSGGKEATFLAVSSGRGYIQIEDNETIKKITLNISKKRSLGWDFSNSSNYSFNSNFIEVNSGRAALKEIDTSFSGSDFEGGSHVGTSVFNNKLSLNPHPSTDFRGINQKWVPRSDKVIWYWSMDSGSLPITDLTNNIDGSNCNSGPTFSSKAMAGDSLLMANGTEGNCEVPSINQISDEITISGWIKNQDGFKAPWLPIITKTNGSRGFNIHRNNTSNEIYLRVDTDLATNSSCFSTGATPLNGEWNHIAFTLNRGDIKSFVNGVLVNQCSYSHGIGFSTTSETLLRFFRVSYGSGETRFDEWAFWSAELSEDEVFSIYDHQRGNFSELSSNWTPHWSDIVGYWKMDGNWQDSSGKGNNLVALGNAGFSDTSKVGNQSASFDGIDAKAQGPQSSDILSDANQEISIFFWAKPSNISSSNISNRIISIHQGSTASSALAIGFGNFNKLQFYNSVSAVTRSWDKDVSINEWYHVGLVYNGTCFQKYLNGNKEGPCIVENLSAGGSFKTMIGSFNENDNNLYSGLIDELAIWKKALTASDALDIYNHQKQKIVASYQSPVIDLVSPQDLLSLSKITDLPFMKELSKESESSSDYASLSGDLNDRLIGYWPLNGLIGIASDDDTVTNQIGASGDGLIKDSDLINTIEYSNGVMEQAISLDGQNDYIEIADLDLAQNDRLSISIWVKASPESNTYMISQYNHGDANDRSWLLGKSSIDSSKAMFIISSDGSLGNRKSYHSSIDVFDGSWHHLVGTFFQGETKIFIDGVEDLFINKSVDTPITTIHNSSTNIRIGAGSNNGTLSNFSHGFIDEVAIWNKALSSTEVRELYRRGANRIKYQVRTCSDSTCSGDPEWKGPGGDGTTYFSELHNRSSTDISSMFSSCDSSGDNLCSADEFSFTGATQAIPYRFDFVESLINNYSALNTRYFQYRVLMEAEENTACGGEPCLPSLTAINFETANDYYDISPSVTSTTPITISSEISKVEENVTGGCSVKYQFSKDGTNFSYYNSGSWTTAIDTEAQANTVGQISSTLKDFISSGSLYVRAYLTSNGTQSCELQSLSITQ